MIALREIAEPTLSPDDMRETLITSIQKNTKSMSLKPSLRRFAAGSPRTDAWP